MVEKYKGKSYRQGQLIILKTVQEAYVLKEKEKLKAGSELWITSEGFESVLRILNTLVSMDPDPYEYLPYQGEKGVCNMLVPLNFEFAGVNKTRYLNLKNNHIEEKTDLVKYENIATQAVVLKAERSKIALWTNRNLEELLSEEMVSVPIFFSNTTIDAFVHRS
ncbi:hypothetical protein M0802_012733 [Mischocyttarus mexicanus]|nr:hypothetical protein M0802_012733 [Mischocyttarus mexicanus]